MSKSHQSLPLLILFLILLPLTLVFKYLFNFNISDESVINSVAALTYAYMATSYAVLYNKNLATDNDKYETYVKKFKPLAYCWIAYLILAYIFVYITKIDMPLTNLFVATTGVVGVVITGNKVNNFSIHGSNFSNISKDVKDK